MNLRQHLHCPWLAMALGGFMVGLANCSSARLDPTSRALTFYQPSSERSTAPGAAGAPSSASHQQSRLPPAQAASVAGAPSTAGTTVAAGPIPLSCSNLPDPAPLKTDRWVALAVRFDRGFLDIASATQRQTRRAETSRRVIGRFAAELWIGCELVDRVRFDFPLLAAEGPVGQIHDPSFEASAHFEATVMVADSERATRLEIIDRATQRRRRFDWPLRIPVATPTVDGTYARPTVPSSPPAASN